CEAIVIQFSVDFIQSFTQHQECRYIEDLLAKSTAGLSFNKSGIEMLHHKIQQLPERKDADRIIGLLSILNELSHQKSKPLSSTYFQPLLGTQYEKRINKVCQFIQKNADETLSLKKVASLVSLSESAFCKFFKRLTGKTYSDYVNEVRIGRACERILDTDKTIAETAYASGFESLTYFNRVFLRKKGLTPKQYRKQISVK
ncbi:MAG: AraC family transcriptional regulator, partial [Cyclobacteriaceae bacterium]|nr:AraC family transcriptional regulator [Cyclobacteriaceae bacterium]